MPYQQTACDILEFSGVPSLVVVDIFSKWIDIVKLSGKSASCVILVLKNLFAVHGVPEILIADNNPFKSYDLLDFAKDSKQGFSVI